MWFSLAVRRWRSNYVWTGRQKSRSASDMHMPTEIANLRSFIKLEEFKAVINDLQITDLHGIAEKYPAASVAIGYGLLRGDSPELVDQISDTLKRVLPDVPDTYVIAGERSARAGKHGEAAASLIHAETLGLPCFSFGMTYLSDRLRLFSRVAYSGEETQREAQRHGLTRPLIAQAGETLARLEPFVQASDFDGPATLYVGIDPYHPSGAVLSSEEFASASGSLAVQM